MIRKLLRFGVLALTPLFLVACSASSETPEPLRLLTSTDIQKMSQSITKPAELTKFSPGDVGKESPAYKEQWEYESEECNTVIDVQFFAGLGRTGMGNFPQSTHPRLRGISDATGIQYTLRNRGDDYLSTENIDQWKQDQAAGIDSENATVTLSWLLFQSPEEAGKLVADLSAWIEPCGTLMSESFVDSAMATVSLSDSLVSFQDLEGANGFAMERVSGVIFTGDGYTNEYESYRSTFMVQHSNVVAVVNYSQTEGAVQTLGYDSESVWNGAWDLIDQSVTHFSDSEKG